MDEHSLKAAGFGGLDLSQVAKIMKKGKQLAVLYKLGGIIMYDNGVKHK